VWLQGLSMLGCSRGGIAKDILETANPKLGTDAEKGQNDA